jgi:AcrR family transcriptional regulator
MAKPYLKPNLSAEAWAEAALDAIARGGVSAVAVEPLAKELGVTKGSFYWHFSNREALLDAALELWERRETEAVLDKVRREKDPRLRIEVLFREVTGNRRTSPLYLALSAASNDPRIGSAVRRVAERRLDFLAECFTALGLGEEEARRRAIMAYSLYLGMLQLQRDARHALPRAGEVQRFVEEAVALLAPRASTSSSEEGADQRQ